MTGITLPRRLMTPRTWCGTCGTCVMSITLMISRTFNTGSPYSSRPIAKVRYFPPVAEAFVARCDAAAVCMSVSGLQSSLRLRGCGEREEAAGVENQADAAITEDRASSDAL